MLQLPHFSFGIGDRFARQGAAQLAAFRRLEHEHGLVVTPVWNKSNREHNTVHSEPASTRQAADAAVQVLAWPHGHFVDADHITLQTVDRFLPHCDFFTLDVADAIGRRADDEAIIQFMLAARPYLGELKIDGIASPFIVSEAQVHRIAETYLYAAQQAGALYRHIRATRGEHFVAEVSMDEVEAPQSPVELFFILLALSREGVRLQTIAPKFTGRFNKGVDYVGDAQVFAREFEQDVHVLRAAVRAFGLPANLKLSVHSGSDKYTLYPIIRRVLAQTGAGLHLKTAGTTWLEEVIGLARAGAQGLVLEIYARAYDRFDELVGPYASVLDVQRPNLPAPEDTARWDGARWATALHHEPAPSELHHQLRQFMHVSYKVAAELGSRYLEALRQHAPVVAEGVTDNLYRRHLVPLFAGLTQPKATAELAHAIAHEAYSA